MCVGSQNTSIDSSFAVGSFFDAQFNVKKTSFLKLGDYTFFKRKWFPGKQYLVAQKLREVQYWTLRHKKLFSVHVFKVRFICVQNVMHVMLARY